MYSTVKRTAETITYGNHQNTPRVKKAGPLPPLAPPSEMKQEEAELDKKASVQSEVVPAEGSPDMALEGNPAMEGVIQNMVQPAAQEDPTEEEEDLQQLVGKEPEEEAALDSLVQQTEDLPPLTPPEPEAAAMEGKPEADYDYNRQFQEEGKTPGPRLNIKTVSPGMGIPMLQIRRSWDRLIFNMGIPILVRRHLYTETAPRWHM